MSWGRYGVSVCVPVEVLRRGTTRGSEAVETEKQPEVSIKVCKELEVALQRRRKFLREGELEKERSGRTMGRR